MVNRRKGLYSRMLVEQKLETFGELVKRHRTSLGIGINELGRLTDLSPSYISRIERGSRGIVTVPVFLTICERLSIDWIEALKSYEQHIFAIREDE